MGRASSGIVASTLDYYVDVARSATSVASRREAPKAQPIWRAAVGQFASPGDVPSCCPVCVVTYMLLRRCAGIVIPTPGTSETTSPVAGGSMARDIAARLDGRISEFTLPNGLHFVVMERHVAPIVACHTYANVGAWNEEEGQTGTRVCACVYMYCMCSIYMGEWVGPCAHVSGYYLRRLLTLRMYTVYTYTMYTACLCLRVS